MKKLLTIILIIVFSVNVNPVCAANGYTGELELDTSDYFDGADKAAYDVTSGFTIEAWIKPGTLSSGGDDRTMVDRYYDGSTRAWIFSTTRKTGEENDETKLRFYCGNAAGSAGQIFYSNTGSVSAGSWQHIAVVFDDTANLIRFYVDGVAKGTGSKTDALGTNNETLQIGSYSGASAFFDGLIDEVRIWSMARTPAQINAHKDCGIDSATSSLIGYWKMENNGDDETSTGNALSANNSATYQSGDVPTIADDCYVAPAAPTTKKRGAFIQFK